VASFSETVELAKPPEAVFPWLFEQDKVPQWTGGLEEYEVLGGGPIAVGTRVRQVLNISGQRVELELEITRYDPPTAADSHFSMSGVAVEIAYALEASGGGSRLTQTLEGHASSFKARMLLPMVQPRLERKLTEDLERLREVLSG